MDRNCQDSRRCKPGGGQEELLGAPLLTPAAQHDTQRLSAALRTASAARLVFVALLLFSLTTVSAAAAVTQSNLYITCKTDPSCAAQFHLIYADPTSTSTETLWTLAQSSSYERKLFDFLLHQYLEDMALPADAVETSWTNNNTTTLSDTDRLGIWLVILRLANFCDANQEFVLDAGCRCKADEKKGCSQSNCSTLEYITFIVAVSLVAVVTLFATYRALEKTAMLQRHANEIVRRGITPGFLPPSSSRVMTFAPGVQLPPPPPPGGMVSSGTGLLL